VSNPTPPPDPRNLDAAVKAFQTMPVPAPPADDSLLARLAGSPAEPVPRSRRRMVMRIATWSLAASVLAAGAVLLFGGASAPTLAAVLREAEKCELVKYTMTESCDDKDNGFGQSERVVYADLKKPRWRTETATMLGVNDRVLEYRLVQIDDQVNRKHVTVNELLEWVGETKTDVPNPRPFLESLREFQRMKGVTTDKDTLDGKAVVRFRHEENGKTMVLVVDAKTKLPVRLEFEQTDPTPNIAKIRIEYSDFEWDPRLPAGMKTIDDLFDTTPPKGYTVSEAQPAWSFDELWEKRPHLRKKDK
jgi:hypothetical protein